MSTFLETVDDIRAALDVATDPLLREHLQGRLITAERHAAGVDPFRRLPVPADLDGEW